MRSTAQRNRSDLPATQSILRPTCRYREMSRFYQIGFLKHCVTMSAFVCTLALFRSISRAWMDKGTQCKEASQSFDTTEKHVRKPTIESVHKNVELGNSYRMELLKQSLTIAAAILAFTVTFRPTLTRVDYAWLMWGGWLALGVSVACGMLHMLLWSHFYLSHRDYDWHDRPVEGKAHRKFITGWRRFVMLLQFLGLACGVTGIGLFAALNFANTVAPK